MAFLFECPQCGTRKTIADAAVGRRVRCPHCEALVEITPPEDEVVDLEPAVTGESAESLQVISGVAISAPSLQADWNISAPSSGASTPGVPVLAIADDDESDEAVQIKSKFEDSEMDMTPMVDVTFQLLIFFMVTASFSMQKSLEIPAPQETIAAASTKTLQDYEEDPEFVTVRIDRNSTFFVTAAQWSDEAECPSEQELLAKLRQAREGSGGEAARKMLVVAHGDAVHERVVMAIDAGMSAGIEDVQLLSVEDDDTSQ